MSCLLPSSMSGGQHATDCIGLVMQCDIGGHMWPKQGWDSAMP